MGEFSQRGLCRLGLPDCLREKEKSQNPWMRRFLHGAEWLSTCLQWVPTKSEINYPKVKWQNLLYKIELDKSIFASSGWRRILNNLKCQNTQGLYKCKRLPSVLKGVPEIFLQVIDTILSDLILAITYLGDILIKVKTVRWLFITQMKYLEKINFCRSKLSDEKCVFFISKIKYLSLIINRNQRKPGQPRVFAITNILSRRKYAVFSRIARFQNYYVFLLNMNFLASNIK